MALTQRAKASAGPTDSSGVIDAILAGGAASEAVQQTPVPSVPSFEQPLMDKIASHAIDMGASDITINVDDQVCFTVRGDIVRVPDYGVMTPGVVDNQLYSKMTTAVNQMVFAKRLELDASYVLRSGPHAGRRLRVAVGLSFGNIFMTMRVIPDEIPSPRSLGVSPVLDSWAMRNTGFSLVCGTTGSGKTTTLASLVNEVRLNTRKNIVTLENPIEYRYSNLDTEAPHGHVTQREIVGDFRDFESAIATALRMNPDIVLIGELRTGSDIRNALWLASSGHGTLSTMHTASAQDTINLIRSWFEGEERAATLQTLANTLTGVCNQNLVKSADGSRFVLAQSVFENNSDTNRMIADGDTRGIEEYMRDNGFSMEQVLAGMVNRGEVRFEDAVARTKGLASAYFTSLIDSDKRP